MDGRMTLPIPNRMDIALDMPSAFGFGDARFTTMDNYWATVLYTQRNATAIAEKRRIPIKAARQLLAARANAYHARTPFEFGDIIMDVRLLKEGTNRSVIIMSNILGIEEFYSGLRKELEVDIPIPPLYVTLYTVQEQRPIDVASIEEMERSREKLSPDEARALKGLAIYGEVR